MDTLPISLHPRLICDAHGVFDSLPCPWPHCKSGHSHDRFQTAPLFEGKDPTTYVRRIWKSPVGDEYYTWDGDNLPNWFSVTKTLWNEARRLRLVTYQPRELIYHYTTVEGLAGIVESQAIWLSDYSYLNDMNELTHGMNLIRDVASMMLTSEKNPMVTDLLATWSREIENHGNRVCIAAFSGDDDSLSQWRAYGPVAVGFKALLPIGYASQTNLMPVEYDREIQRKLISIYLSHLCQAFVLDQTGGRLDRIEDVYQKTDKLVELIAFFKDPAFRSEHEYRLAYIENPQVFQSLGLPLTPKRFRVARGKILPYVSSRDLSTPGMDVQQLGIREVVLGPGADDLLERGVREFLEYHGKSDVKVRRSQAPYRT